MVKEILIFQPRPDAYPTPVLERGLTTVGLMRNPSNLSYSSRSLSIGQTRRSFKKSKVLGKGYFFALIKDRNFLKECILSTNFFPFFKIYSIFILGSDVAVASDEKKRADIEETRLTRESIIEKLKRFFRSRPSIESLKEKGIYKR